MMVEFYEVKTKQKRERELANKKKREREGGHDLSTKIN